MPWHVAKSASCPKSRPWAVIKDSDSSKVACHPTKAAAQKQVAALYANEGTMSSTTIDDVPTREAPTDNLVRALFGTDAAELRVAADGDGRTLSGHFAVFDKWTEINSSWEGRFMERIQPGAFANTIEERGDQIKVLYDHGQDPQLGNKPLGTIESLAEDKIGAAYTVRLLDTPYNRDFIVPAGKAGLLGASFRFQVVGDEWDHEPEASRTNPAKLPERTITEARVFEFGPVTFPAYAEATASVRCGTDRFLDSLMHDPQFMVRMVERVGPNTIKQILAGLPPEPETVADTDDVLSRDDDTTNEAGDAPDQWSIQARRDRMAADGLTT